MLGVPLLWNPPPVEGAPLSTHSELRLSRGLSRLSRGKRRPGGEQGQLSLRLQGVLVWHAGRRKGTPRGDVGRRANRSIFLRIFSLHPGP